MTHDETKDHSRALIVAAKPFTIISALPVLLVLALSALTTPAGAGVIIAPTTATADVTGLLGPATNTTDQSGLSANYISGITDFDTFVTSGVTAAGGASAIFIPSPINHLSLLTFGFGSTVSIESIAVWNNSRTTTGAGSGIDAISGFDLFADTDSDFGNGTSANLGSFIMPAISLGSAPAEVFSFAAASTPFVHFRITGTQAGERAGINEVAFEVAATSVPEPATAILLALGLAGVGFKRRRIR